MDPAPGGGCRPAIGSGSASFPAPRAAVCPVGTRTLPTAGRTQQGGAQHRAALTSQEQNLVGGGCCWHAEGAVGATPPPKHPPGRLCAAEAARWGAAVPVPRGSSPLAHSALPALPNWFPPPPPPLSPCCAFPAVSTEGNRFAVPVQDSGGSPIPWRWEGLGGGGAPPPPPPRCWPLYGASLLPIPRGAAGDPKPAMPQGRCPRPVVARSG